MLTRLALLLTAAEAIWLIPFTLGCLFLAAVAIERAARWLAPDTDPRRNVTAAHEWEEERP